MKNSCFRKFLTCLTFFIFILALIFFYFVAIFEFFDFLAHKKKRRRARLAFINEPLQVRMIRNENLRNLNIPGDEPLEIWYFL